MEVIHPCACYNMSKFLSQCCLARREQQLHVCSACCNRLLRPSVTENLNCGTFTALCLCLLQQARSQRSQIAAKTAEMVAIICGMLPQARAYTNHFCCLLALHQALASAERCTPLLQYLPVAIGAVRIVVAALSTLMPSSAMQGLRHQGVSAPC